MKRFALTAVIVLCAFVSHGARADTIFEETFQNGKTDRWGGSGEGDLRLTTYDRNISLRLQHRAAAVAKVSTAGYLDVVAAVSFAASSLKEGEECAAELSVDGETWVKFFSIGHGQDDGLTLHEGRGSVPGLDDNPNVFIGLRVRGSDDNSTCWADNIKLSGRLKTSARAPATGGRLTASSLAEGRALAGLLPFAAYAPPAVARSPSNRLQGKLTLTLSDAKTFYAFRDAYGDTTANNKAAQSLPPFDFEFVQDGDRLIPVLRGPIRSSHANWEWILEPGRVWDEADDNGFTRAGIPFALQERNANCTHYGALTFLFKADGTTTNAAFQIAGETCAYFNFDFYGIARVAYQPHDISNAAEIVAAYRAELSSRLPVAPIAQLARDHPGADPSQFGSPVEINPDDMTAYGFVIDGKHYVGGCETRAGTYPDCDVLPLPSYSTAKSLFAGLAAMRMERLYPGTLQLHVADLVPECSTSGQWRDVTLANALNMATGNLASTGMEVDERSAAVLPFFLAADHAGKIKAACGMFGRKAVPGTTFAYHTIDSYILGTALAAALHAKRGASADLYRDIIVDPVWRPLNLSPDIYSTKRTYDSVAQPFTGFGLTYHRDDIARLAMFLNEKGGVVNGAHLFDDATLQSALQHNPSDRGLIANGDKFRYRNGFWAWDATDYLKCAKETWIPFMSGFGGITVALLPNDTIYYYFSDGDAYAWGRAAAEANRIRKFC